MGELYKRTKKCGILLFSMLVICCMFFLIDSRVQAEEGGRQKVVKVAFAEVPGFSEKDEDGTRHGIIVDYLDEIAKYTGWEYEYIDTNGDTMIDEFLEGKYDLMGGTYYVGGFEKYFAYPDYNTGYSKSVLLAREDDDSIKSYDFKSMAGKTIGVYKNAAENIRRLEIFLESNAIDCTLKYYTYDQLVDGNLYKYLEDGDVDMLLGNNAEDIDTLRVVAAFNSQPHYIVTTLDNQEVLDGLNMALEKIIDSTPNFAEERYDANFQDSGIASIHLTEEERAYVKKKKTVSVAIVKEWHPFYCMETKEHLHNGLVPDVLDSVAEFTGLKFEYIYADSYNDAIELVHLGKADILGAFLGTEAESSRNQLALTTPYVTMNDIIARNKAVSYPSEGLTGATLEGRELPSGIEAEEVRHFSSVTEALKAVDRGEVDFFYGLSLRIEQDLQLHHYTNVVLNTLVNSPNEITFAISRPAEADLLTVLNKAISSLDTEEKNVLANKNMISTVESSLSLVEMIYANPLMFVTIIGGIFVLIVILVMVVARSSVRAARMQSNLEKAEAASRAKGEFLSRMSHEIRTPMNAIVGLSDLTCRMEDVPDKVHVNLEKIRSSCHYLLQLISDILDMSKIESGKLTIDKEAFSLKRILDELDSMMTIDAKQRGLKFVMAVQARHDILVGDSIRLKQVLTNLISNAFKFTPTGGQVQVRVQETNSSQSHVSYRFQVIDNGMGISEEHQERIFEAFEQVGPNMAKSQGTGLGLAISKTIVQLMGGELKLKSTPGQGCEFYFTSTFPVGCLDETPGEEQDYSLKGKCILIAEDNDLNAEITQELLKIQEAEVYRAADGKLAAEMFERSTPGTFQAILMDIQMPVMDGLESCRTIRAMERPDAQDIPILAMTANSFKEDADAAKMAGMDGFITKPVDVEQLYRELQRVLNQ